MSEIASKETKTKTKPVQEEKFIDPHEMVTIKLHMDKDHTESIFVSINDFEDHIPRGVYYQVPYYVKVFIDEMDQQDMDTVRTIAGLIDNYEQSINEHMR